MDAIFTRSLRDQLYDVILDRIVTLRYRPGERLSPDDLRAEFGVSVTPVRESLQRLANDGFVEIRAREGAYVARLDAGRAAEVYEIRAVLEGLAARRAATRVPDSELDALDARFAKADAALAAGAGDDALEPLEPAIHELMAAWSDNAMLGEMLQTVTRQGAWARMVAGHGVRYLRSAFDEHKLILDALRRHDPDAAEAATRRHLEATRLKVVEYLSRQAEP